MRVELAVQLCAPQLSELAFRLEINQDKQQCNLIKLIGLEINQDKK